MIGLHSWNGCKCSKCGKIRDENHFWKKDDCGICERCGKVKDENHSWGINDCSVCEKCGKVKNENHSWSGCKCSKCGKTRNENHSWDGCKCSECGQTRDENHSWKKDDCSICEKCGKTNIDRHQLENGLCKVCRYGTFTDQNDGRTYKIIKIGDQIIMAENLAYKPSSGKFWDNDVSKYGYLYNSETAKQIAGCIKGWHLPSKEEWDTLYNFLSGDYKKVYSALINGGSSGFNALFGGFRGSNSGLLKNTGNDAVFWSSTDSWAFYCYCDRREAGIHPYDLLCGFSVRLFRDCEENQHDWSKDCEKCSNCGKERKLQHVWNGCVCKVCRKSRDEQHDWSKNCNVCNKCGNKRIDGHTFVNGYCSHCKIEEKEGVFIDERDGKKYKTIKIGTQTIMAENLAFRPISGNYWGVDNNQNNITKYGYLYDWETANKVAPIGWHLPTKDEWNTLYNHLGNDDKKVYAAIWKDELSGFKPLLGGCRNKDGQFVGLGNEANFWSSTASNDDRAWYFSLFNMDAELRHMLKLFGASIRLFKNK